MRRSSRLCVRPTTFSFVFLFVALFIGTAQSALSKDLFELNGDPAILSEAATRHRANRASIRTWQGEAYIIDVHVRGDEQSTSRSSASFIYRADPYAEQWTWRPEIDDDPAAHTVHADNGLMTADRVILASLNYRGDADNLLKTVRIVEHSDLSTSPMISSFRPTYYLGRRGEDLAKRFEYFLSNKDRLRAPWSVRREEDAVTVEAERGVSLNRYVVDLSQGANLVHYEVRARDAAGEVYCSEIWSWKYMQVGDAWIPSSLRYELRGTPGPINVPRSNEDFAKKRSTRQVLWRNQTVNQPISPDELSMSALGVEVGELITDTINRKSYRFGD